MRRFIAFERGDIRPRGAAFERHSGQYGLDDRKCRKGPKRVQKSSFLAIFGGGPDFGGGAPFFCQKYGQIRLGGEF